MSYGNNNQQRGPANYLRTSSLKKTLHFNDQVDPQTGKPVKQQQDYAQEVTEEISFTLTYEKAQDLINRIVAAQNDQTGTGGVRISMYCRKSQNQNTGEVFDGAGMLVYATKPPQNGGQGGSFRGGNRGNFRGGGRRDYPPRQAQGFGQPQQQYPQVQGAPGRPPVAPPPQQQQYPRPAPQVMPQAGPVNPGPQTQGYPQAGPGPVAPNNAYPSDEGDGPIPF